MKKDVYFQRVLEMVQLGPKVIFSYISDMFFPYQNIVEKHFDDDDDDDDDVDDEFVMVD